jgi:hypothetical protein
MAKALFGRTNHSGALSQIYHSRLKNLAPNNAKGGVMRCNSCCAEMRVVLVEQDHGMKAVGYEHQTLECVGCQKTERRLAFSNDRSSVENWQAVTAIDAVVPTSLSKIYETLTTGAPRSVSLARGDSKPRCA